MPSKYSERLKQAIEYIRSGEKEIAREIILEIIQADPAYEKAWIWLVETVPDRANKVDILKTRLEQYPETSPFSRIALDKIAPEVLDTLVPPSEAIIYPEGMEPRSEATEDEIQYNVVIDQDDQFRPDDDELIQFEEPEDSSPFEASDSGVLHEMNMMQQEEELYQLDDKPNPKPEDDLFQLESNQFEQPDDDLFAESLRPAPGPEDVDFDFYSDEEGQEAEQQDFDFFEDTSTDSPPPDVAFQGVEDEVDFESWLDDVNTGDSQAGNVDELADLLDDVTDDDDELPIKDEVIDDFGVFGITDDEEEINTAASNPFILDEKSKQILGSDVVDQAIIEAQPLDELFNGASTGDLTPSPDFLDSSDFPMFEPEAEPGSAISSQDLTTASEQFRSNVMAESISSSGERQRERSQQLERRQEKVKTKKKQKNATFVFGCSMIAAAVFISLIGMGYILLRSANEPVYKAVTVTPSPTSTITPTVTAPIVAPWLNQDEEEETADQTLTPEPDDEEGSTEATQTTDEAEEDLEPTLDEIVLTPGEMVTQPGLGGRDLEEWIEFYEFFNYECNPLEGSGNSLVQMCEYLDENHNIIVQLYGTEEIMPTRVEFQVLSQIDEDELPYTPEFETLLKETLGPVVIEPVASEDRDAALDWFTTDATNMVIAGRDTEHKMTFGDITITIEYSDYFLRIEL